MAKIWQEPPGPEGDDREIAMLPPEDEEEIEPLPDVPVSDIGKGGGYLHAP